MQILLFTLLILTIVVARSAGTFLGRRAKEDVIAETQYGRIRGTTTFATNQKTIYSFKSIPFAKPPVRFSAPKALTVEEDGWGDEIRDGTRNPPSCAQYLAHLSPASEDCLYLNVYTPIRPGSSREKLPVMLFIYGGSFLFGDSVIYGPHRLMAQEDVLLVVIHYRLGALGFLSTGDLVVPGNNGFKDQRQALRWVQENIGSFNGDSSRVTLFGESAGASSVVSQLLSPSTAGLFHQVIAQSGTPLSVWAMDTQPLKSAIRFAESVNCTATDLEEMVECMRALPWQILAKASTDNFSEDLENLHLNFGNIALVVEEQHEGAFMTEEPLTILKEGRFPKIPVLLGATQHEGSMILQNAYSGLNASGGLDDPDYVQFELVPALLNAVGLGDERLGSPVSQSVAEYYFPEGRKDNFTEITDGLVDMLSVFFFKAPILRTAEYLSQHSDNIYLYSFERQGFNSLWKLLNDVLPALVGEDPLPIKGGVMHADDLIYFWTLPFVVNGNDRLFSEMVCKMWIDFAVTSNPTPGNNWPKWKNYKTNIPHYYKLDLEPELLLDYTKGWRKGYEN